MSQDKWTNTRGEFDIRLFHGELKARVKAFIEQLRIEFGDAGGKDRRKDIAWYLDQLGTQLREEEEVEQRLERLKLREEKSREAVEAQAKEAIAEAD